MEQVTKEKYKAPIIQDKNGKPVVFTIKRAHQYWAEKARNDVCLFEEFVFDLRPAKHHRQWLEAICHSSDRYILIVSSRGFGKTETIKVALSWWMGKYPEHTNVITSVSKDQAEKRLMDIKDVIMFNPRYKLVFPYVKIDNNKPNTMSEFNIWDSRMSYNLYIQQRSKMGTAKTMSLFATGMGGKSLIGNRITGLAIVDDPHDEDAAYSPVKRSRAIDWHDRTFINCLTGAKAKAAEITTRWHEEDLAGNIMKNKSKMYTVIDTPAEYIDEKSGKRISNWPEWWSIEKLDAQQELIGPSMYRALYLNDIYALSGDVFSIDWLNNQLPPALPEMTQVILSVDPAVTVKTTSDYTGIAMLGIDDKYNLYLLNIWREKMHPKDLKTRLEIFFNEAKEKYGRCDKVLIEKYGTQTLIADKLIDETLLPIHGMALQGDKRVKAQSLEVICSRQKFFADWSDNNPLAQALRSEFLSFPHGGKNDDMVDAIAQGAAYLTLKSGKVKATLKVAQNPYIL